MNLYHSRYDYVTIMLIWTKVIEFLHQTKSVVQVQHEYLRFFKTAYDSNPITIHRTVAKFSTVQTTDRPMRNENKGRSGRRRTALSEETVQAVREAVVWSPRKSIRHLSVESSTHRTSALQSILTSDLNLFPHKIPSQSQLTPNSGQRD